MARVLSRFMAAGAIMDGSRAGRSPGPLIVTPGQGSGGRVRWRLGRKASRPGTLRTASSADIDHLANFVRSRGGVEAYIEPRTAVTETTIVLVASNGEWTRRRVAGAEQARSFTKKHAIPLYDVGVVGYPQRMRDWTAQRKATGETGPPGTSGPST